MLVGTAPLLMHWPTRFSCLPCCTRSPLMRQLVPFLACGDLDGWDADKNYSLPSEDYVHLPPVAPPTAPVHLAAQRQAAAGGEQQAAAAATDGRR